MKDNLTTDMHAEFTIDAETELKHKAVCVWTLLGNNFSNEQLNQYCSLYGITPEQALHFSHYS